MAELARRPNVTVKVGGLGMPMGWFDFYQRPSPPSSQMLADAFKPWVETCIELFGADRCMFESNFPVDKITSGYGVLWNAFKRLAAKASAAEKTALFSGTASARLQARSAVATAPGTAPKTSFLLRVGDQVMRRFLLASVAALAAVSRRRRRLGADDSRSSCIPT